MIGRNVARESLLHGVHVLIGMSVLTWVLIKNIRGVGYMIPARP